MVSPVVSTLQTLVDASSRIVFFGGAGVSTESGIPDFRSQDGLYHQHYAYPPETILSRGFFTAHPEEFFRFYRDRVLHPDAQPNPAHRTLAALEHAGKLQAVVTQNIDGLHQKAGSRRVYELHGSVWRNHCQHCGAAHPLAGILNSPSIVPRCDCGGVIEPGVVLYEDPLDPEVIDAAVTAIAHADLLIIGGTSLVVYPAAGLVDYYRGRHLVVINRDGSAPARRRGVETLIVTEPIGQVFASLRV